MVQALTVLRTSLTARSSNAEHALCKCHMTGNVCTDARLYGAFSPSSCPAQPNQPKSLQTVFAKHGGRCVQVTAIAISRYTPTVNLSTSVIFCSNCAQNPCERIERRDARNVTRQPAHKARDVGTLRATQNFAFYTRF